MDSILLSQFSNWILLTGHLILVGWFVGFCHRRRHRDPVTSRLLLLAVLCRMLPFAVSECVREISWFRNPSAVFFWNQLPAPYDPEFWPLLSIQFFHAVCNSLSWSLIAWAVLMRPKDRLRQPADSGSA